MCFFVHPGSRETKLGSGKRKERGEKTVSRCFPKKRQGLNPPVDMNEITVASEGFFSVNGSIVCFLFELRFMCVEQELCFSSPTCRPCHA